MPRLKNQINDKERKSQVTMTDGTVCYNIPVGEEETKTGHYIDYEKIDNGKGGKTLRFKFATKKETGGPMAKIEHFPQGFDVKFE